MFDDALPDGEALKSADDAMVVAAIAGWARVEAAASARRLAAIAELVSRRVEGGSAERGQWSCDNWDAIAAEVGAAQGISHGVASAQMYLGVALRDRLPFVGALFADGMISARLASAIVWRTDLIKDPELLPLVDKTLAKDVVCFGPLSVNKTAQAVDAIVDRYDPAALRRTRATARSRNVVIDSADDQAGTAAMWGRLYATDAVVLDRRWRCGPRAAASRADPRRRQGEAGTPSRRCCSARGRLPSLGCSGAVRALPRLDMSIPPL